MEPCKGKCLTLQWPSKCVSPAIGPLSSAHGSGLEAVSLGDMCLKAVEAIRSEDSVRHSRESQRMLVTYILATLSVTA